MGAERPRRHPGGSAAGTALVSNIKTNGPLFRQFGTAANVSATDTLLTPSPGLNAVTTNPTRVFPDLGQILANNTNAVTGHVPGRAAGSGRRAGRRHGTASRSSCRRRTGSGSTATGR